MRNRVGCHNCLHLVDGKRAVNKLEVVIVGNFAAKDFWHKCIFPNWARLSCRVINRVVAPLNKLPSVHNAFNRNSELWHCAKVVHRSIVYCNLALSFNNLKRYVALGSVVALALDSNCRSANFNVVRICKFVVSAFL